MTKRKLRFYSGKQVMRHYIPDYDENKKPADMEEQVKRFVVKSIDKLDPRLVPPTASRTRSSSATSRTSQPGAGN